MSEGNQNQQGQQGQDGLLGGVTEQVGQVAQGAQETAGQAVDQATQTAGRARRKQRTGVVTSDKMTRTVVVRVDRLVKHPVYKRYVRRRAKFMAHNEIDGVTLGDMVRIVETRPLSARKRWRVVEVLRKASK